MARLRQNELLAATAVGMYIVFFALSPPDAVRGLLANPIGMAAVFAGSLYVAFRVSKLVGGLLFAAFVISMTRVTEHLTTDTYTGTFNPTPKRFNTGTSTVRMRTEQVRDRLLFLGRHRHLLRRRPVRLLGHTRERSIPPVTVLQIRTFEA